MIPPCNHSQIGNMTQMGMMPPPMMMAAAQPSMMMMQPVHGVPVMGVPHTQYQGNPTQVALIVINNI